MTAVPSTPQTYSVNHPKAFLQQVLYFANKYGTFAFLDHAHPGATAPAFDWMLAIAPRQRIHITEGDIIPALRSTEDKEPAWWFGHICYPASGNPAAQKPFISFPQAHFFSPNILIQYKDPHCTIRCFDGQDPHRIMQQIEEIVIPDKNGHITVSDIRHDTGCERYLRDIQSVLQHIQAGDCYELNYCMAFDADAQIPDPVDAYLRMRELSPNPFSAFYRLDDLYVFCASPERFFQIQSGRIYSQPIKGTAKRYPDDPLKDKQAAKDLWQEEKERAENVMVVDLVRNDLGKICVAGTVQVPELFGVYAFPQVFQMISTVEGFLKPGMNWLDAMEACFPMGSMTGAPKKRVLELIDQYEKRERGLFSGTIGYISPEGNADFNVVIRSLFYDRSREQISFYAGSGITAYCNAEAEYEECLLKTAVWPALLRL